MNTLQMCLDTVSDWATVRHLLIGEALAILFYMTLWFVLAMRKKRLDVVDTAWGGSFVLVAWLAVLVRMSPVAILVAILVSAWGLRLMYYTWKRHKRNERDDPRYTKLSSGWKRLFWVQVFLKVFVLQGVLAILVAAPITMNVRGGAVSMVAYLGALLWALGFFFEAVGDYQLKQFLARPKHKKVMDEGLWRYTRHPNYFGEIMQWVGIGVIALAAPWGWVGLLGPALITILLVFVSGIPTVEKGKDKDPDYRKYQQTTSPLIPLPPKKHASKK